MMSTTRLLVVRKGRPPRVPHERTLFLRVYFAESELARVREAAAANYQSMSEFARLAVSDAAEESGVGPIVVDRRQSERRRRNGDDQPVELERRTRTRRATR